MPEGPEIRRAADRVRRALAGKVASEVFFGQIHLKGWPARLRGQTVTDVRVRGKAMLTEFSDGLTVYSHNQLYGRWYTTRAGNTPATGRQLRFAVHNAKNSAWLYSASDIEVLDSERVAEQPYISRLGPDALEATATELEAYFQEAAGQRRKLASLLLDQGFVAGLGNYLRSEILFVSRLSPNRKLGALSARQRQHLAEATMTITERAYRLRGVTNDPERAEELKAAGKSRAQYRHYVFSRAGQRCYECGTTIAKLSAAGRRLYQCPRCQPEES